jgi:hypothetical protein
LTEFPTSPGFASHVPKPNDGIMSLVDGNIYAGIVKSDYGNLIDVNDFIILFL